MESNRELVRRFLHEAWNRKNIDIIDELLSPAFCRHVPDAPYLLTRDAQKEWILSVHHAFPDVTLAVEDIITEGDMVAFRGLLRGTQTDLFRNFEPSGQQVLLMVVGIMRVEDDLITEQWAGVSEPDLQQLLAVHP